MATEKMRLEAEMRDNASPAIKKLRGELAALQNQTREVRAVGQLNKQIETLRKEAAAVQVTPGMKAMPAWLGSATTAAEGFVKSGGGAAGVISSLGIGGLTAAASLGALISHFREVGEGALSMKEFARQTGVSVDYLNAFEHAGQSFGLRTDTMRKAIEGLADQMPQLKAGFGPLHDFLTGNGWGDLAKKLKTEDTSHALDDILNQLDRIKDPALQKQVLGDILKAPDLEAIYQRGGFKGFVEEMRRQSSKLPHIGEDAFKQAQNFRDSLISFNDALDRFDTKVGPKFLGALSTILDKLTEFFAADHPAIEKMQRSGGAKDEAEREKKGGLDLDDPRVKDALRKKSTYTGSVGLLHNAAFGLPERGAAMTGGIEATIANGTKSGFLAAFRELMSLGSAEAASAGSGGRRILASYGEKVARSSPDGPASRDHNFGLPPRRRRDIGNDGTPYVGQGKPARGASNAEGRERVSSWMTFFQRPQESGGMGMPRDKAQAAVAMMQGESGPNLRPDQEVWDVNGPSGGTAQWHDRAGHHERLSQLKDFAASLHKSWKDMGVQQQFWRKEALGSHKAAFRAMMAARTPEGALAAGVAGFEVPRDVAGETRKRLGYLRRLQADNKSEPGLANRRATGLDDASPISAAARAHVHLQIDHHPESRVRVVKPSRDVTTIMRSRWPSGGREVEA